MRKRPQEWRSADTERNVDRLRRMSARAPQSSLHAIATLQELQREFTGARQQVVADVLAVAVPELLARHRFD